MALEISPENFDSLRKDNSAFIAYFSAAWCGPCKVLSPLVETLVRENPDVVIGKVDLTKYKEFSVGLGIISIPTLVFYKDGNEVTRHKGIATKKLLQDMINSLK